MNYQLKASRIITSTLFGITILLIVFQKSIETLVFNENNTILNQVALIIIVLLAIIPTSKNLKLPKKYFAISAIFIYLVLVSALFGKNISVTSIVIQVILHLQLFIILASFHLIKTKFNINYFQIFLTVIVISIIGVLLQFILPSNFVEIFTPSEIVLRDFNRGEIKYWGFQLNPNSLGVLCSFFIILLLQYHNLLKKRVLLILILLACSAVILSGSRTALLFVLIGFLFSSITKTKKIISVVSIVAILSVSGIINTLSEKTEANIESVSAIDETRYIRWLMAYHGAMLAVDYFPIGTGAATFGTVLSDNSPVYSEVGIASLPTVEEGTGIHDSNFGSIAGEFGIIGLLIFYGYGWVLVNQIIKKKGTVSKKDGRFLFLICIIGMFSTFMRPLFLSTYYSVLFGMLIFSYLELDMTKIKMTLTTDV